MNCPYHILIYKKLAKSYRDLPVRLAELGTVYRYERSGALRGLIRVRCLTQNDAHIFCTPDQIKRGSGRVIDFARGGAEGFRLHGIQGRAIDAGTRRTRRSTSTTDEKWELGDAARCETLDSLGLPYTKSPAKLLSMALSSTSSWPM